MKEKLCQLATEDQFRDSYLKKQDDRFCLFESQHSVQFLPIP